MSNNHTFFFTLGGVIISSLTQIIISKSLNEDSNAILNLYSIVNEYSLGNFTLEEFLYYAQKYVSHNVDRESLKSQGIDLKIVQLIKNLSYANSIYVYQNYPDFSLDGINDYERIKNEVTLFKEDNQSNWPIKSTYFDYWKRIQKRIKSYKNPIWIDNSYERVSNFAREQIDVILFVDFFHLERELLLRKIL